MILPSDAGWSAPRIATHLGVCGQTVRDLLRAFLARGFDVLYPFCSGPEPNTAQLDRVAEALRRLLAQERTLDQSAARPRSRRGGDRPGSPPSPPPPEADPGPLPAHRLDPEA
ncbi:helix-turn-helix domain-containing protein [Singulisphaera acidiphila]|uniref:Uncharacterized protein n=1 Tax=Singulisphaera acidiphila (strain ATCC BAA-1392 / DSM 18658 / VKM B-2454 / MOB10) TaxID=886293 RepID=L0DKX4_SINAD|nr:helix-turn-helix domain-containing protein [Singulisphaera acidiphila]AGA30034.1 hypothetical protein Sinac_5919 [Singulisphaera acidiphila DSM 18658]